MKECRDAERATGASRHALVADQVKIRARYILVENFEVASEVSVLRVESRDHTAVVCKRGDLVPHVGRHKGISGWPNIKWRHTRY